MARTRTVLFPGLWCRFFVDITGFYLLPCRLKFLLLWNDCLCSWILDLRFRVAAAHCVWLGWNESRVRRVRASDCSPLTLF